MIRTFSRSQMRHWMRSNWACRHMKENPRMWHLSILKLEYGSMRKVDRKKILASGGKEVLIKSVAHDIPTFSVSCSSYRGVYVRPSIRCCKVFDGAAREDAREPHESTRRLPWHLDVQSGNVCYAGMAHTSESWYIEFENHEGNLLPVNRFSSSYTWFLSFPGFASPCGGSWYYGSRCDQENRYGGIYTCLEY